MVAIPSPTPSEKFKSQQITPLNNFKNPLQLSPCLDLLQTIMDRPPLTNNPHTTNHAKTSPWFFHPPHTEDIRRLSHSRLIDIQRQTL